MSSPQPRGCPCLWLHLLCSPVVRTGCSAHARRTILARVQFSHAPRARSLRHTRPTPSTHVNATDACECSCPAVLTRPTPSARVHKGGCVWSLCNYCHMGLFARLWYWLVVPPGLLRLTAVYCRG